MATISQCLALSAWIVFPYFELGRSYIDSDLDNPSHWSSLMGSIGAAYRLGFIDRMALEFGAGFGRHWISSEDMTVDDYNSYYHYDFNTWTAFVNARVEQTVSRATLYAKIGVRADLPRNYSDLGWSIPVDPPPYFASVCGEVGLVGKHPNNSNQFDIGLVYTRALTSLDKNGRDLYVYNLVLRLAAVYVSRI